MKKQFLVTVACGSAIASIFTAVLAQSSHAQTPRIDCITPDTQPTTKITTLLNDGKQEVLELHWYTKFGREAKQLCQQATEKMRRYTQNGEQFYINSAQIQGKFVLCFVKNTNDNCSSNRDFLFTPRKENNPEQFLSDLIKSYILDRTAEGSVFPRYPNRRPGMLRFLLPF